MPLFEAIRLGKAINYENNDTYLFQNVSFSLNKGDIVSIRGPSGSGKSTLLKCIAGLETFDQGKAFLNAKSAEQIGYAVWRSKVLYLPQRPPVIPGTPLDFFNTVCKFSSRSSSTSLHASSHSPQSYSASWNLPDRVWTSPIAQLSGGELQRVFLAICFALEPDILLLDECMSGLDKQTRSACEASLRGRTAIWVGHDPSAEERIGVSTVVELKPPFDTTANPPPVQRKKTNSLDRRSKKRTLD